MDRKKGEAVKVIPIDGCYLHVRYERLLGDKRKTANAFRTGWVTNISTIHPATCRDVGGTTHAKSFYKYWNSRDFWGPGVVSTAATTPVTEFSTTSADGHQEFAKGRARLYGCQSHRRRREPSVGGHICHADRDASDASGK